MGLNMKEKQAVTREYKTRYQAAAKQAKSALLDECIRLPGYHRTYAARVLRTKPVREVLLSADGNASRKKSVRRTAGGSGCIPMRSSPPSG
jgi:ABC-type oligopeptide transport system substrate-binding subunit